MADDDIEQIEYESAPQAVEQTGQQQALEGVDEVQYQRRKPSNIEKAEAAAAQGGSAVLAGGSRVASVLGGVLGAGVATLKKIPTPGQSNQPQQQSQPQRRMQSQPQAPPRNIYPQPPPTQMSQMMPRQPQQGGVSLFGGALGSSQPPAFNLGGPRSGGPGISVFGGASGGQPPAFNLGFGQPQRARGMKLKRGAQVQQPPTLLSLFGRPPVQVRKVARRKRR